ncbi:MAG: tripartite tricarboxylate transporter permease [Candidatus Methylomirabilia bacterium]
MEGILADLLVGFQQALTGYHLMIAAIGVALGTMIGAMPGLGPSNGVAILLPVTFIIPPSAAIIFVAGIYYGACYGAAISSILLGIPGASIAVPTTFDGRPMALQGRGAQALIAAATSSFVGGTVGIILLTLLAMPLAEFALKFGPPENFAIMMLAFATFVGLGGKDPFKTLISICIGLIVSAVSLDIVSGRPRLIYGDWRVFYHGIGFLVVTIGVFGIGEILATVEQNLRFEITPVKIRLSHYWETFRELARYKATFIRSALFGYFIGVVPAAGATPASFMSYGLTKTFGRDREKLGQGSVEGVVAPETANNAASTGAFLPMFTMAIPGSPTTAVILGALMVWGLRPGPLLFTEEREFVWGMIASMYTGNIMAVLLNTLFVPVFVALLRTPFTIMAPLVVVLSLTGGFAAEQAFEDIWWVLIFGLMGYMFKKLDYPPAPMILALVLGNMTETALRQSLILSHGSLAIFFTQPIAAAFMTISVLLVMYPFLRPALKRLFISIRHASSPGSDLSG